MSAEKQVSRVRYIIATVIISHLLSLALPMFNDIGMTGDEISVLQAIIEIPIAMVIELLLLLSVAVYCAAIIRRGKPRTETTIGVFNGSLALSLAAPALLLPLAGSRASRENWLFYHSPDTAFHSPLAGFWVWVISIILIGITIHLVTVTRWKRLAYCHD